MLFSDRPLTFGSYNWINLTDSSLANPNVFHFHGCILLLNTTPRIAHSQITLVALRTDEWTGSTQSYKKTHTPPGWRLWLELAFEFKLHEASISFSQLCLCALADMCTLIETYKMIHLIDLSYFVWHMTNNHPTRPPHQKKKKKKHREQNYETQ